MSEFAWAAGLFEGEGCFAMSRYHGCHLRARLVMTDEEIVRRFGRTVAYGHVTGPRVPKNEKWNPYWEWQATGSGVEAVFALLAPWLGKRRTSRFYELLNERRAYELKAGIEHQLTAERAELIAAYLRRAEKFTEHTKPEGHVKED